MNEVKTPKKPLIFYYLIALALILGLNFLFMPWLMQRTVEEVDYGTFIKMTNDKEIGRVEVQDNQIVFTDKDENKIYKTGRMDDPELVDRLYESGAEFASEIVEQTSPFLTFILSWVLPIVIFIGIGQYMTKKLMDHAGGGSSSMAFGMGKSNAKVYVKSSDGIKFADVAGEDEAKENLKEIVDYLHTPERYREIHAKGYSFGGSSGNRKNDACQGGCRRSRSAVFLHVRF